MKQTTEVQFAPSKARLFAIPRPTTCHASPQAGFPEEAGEFPASAIHHSSGLTVGEGISPLEGMVFTLWFYGTQGPALKGNLEDEPISCCILTQ